MIFLFYGVLASIVIFALASLMSFRRRVDARVAAEAALKERIAALARKPTLGG